MKKTKPKKEKIIWIDDGSTVSDMNVEGMPWYVKGGHKKKKPDRLKFKEKLAVVFGAYKAYLPFLITIILSIAFVFVLIWLWWG